MYALRIQLATPARCPLYAVRRPLSEIRATSDEILSTNWPRAVKMAELQG